MMAEIGHATFRVKRPYHRIGLHLQMDDTVDLPVELAAWIERDQADTLEHVGAIPQRAIEEPQQDRMVHQAETREEPEINVPRAVQYGATKSGRKR
jgi:hypothetical protein